jgi:hypothetical protein
MSIQESVTERQPVAPKSTFSRSVGVDHLTVGLSPTYWAHVPLLIYELHNLRLVQGVSCLVQELDGQEKLIPISRCKLTGTIVSVERTSASVVYVIDDGTGLVDCLFWLERDAYTLPSLLFEDNNTGEGILPVGEIVRVLGRIECVAVRANGLGMASSSSAWVGSDAIREIHASVVEPLTSLSSTKSMPQTLDAESQHWISCARVCVSPSTTPNSALLNNAADVLALLGPEIAAQVNNRINIVAASGEDYSGAWRVFGMECRCESVYKDALLYCHCLATPELLDPEYRYRDALLLTLLDMESGLVMSGSPDIPAHLRFQYKTVAHHSRLHQIASEEVTKSKSGGPIGNAKRLISNTFRSLRQDGIVYLIDEQSDTYLFVSRSKVLEPYLQTIQSTCPATAVAHQRNKPAYLSKVPKARLQFIRKELLAQRQSDL